MSRPWRKVLRDVPVVGDSLAWVRRETLRLAQLRDGLQQLQRNQANLALALARTGPGTAPGSGRLTSCLCTQSRCQNPEFERWCRALGEAPRLHRKLWEFVFIAQALDERGFLRAGRRGLGFGVGREPLVACFAARGCDVVATDMGAAEAQDAGWRASGQHSAAVEELNDRGLCPPEAFRERVRYRPVDMNAIPDDLTGFDFCWSACAFEHLGSLEAGMAFVERSVETLAPGGVAVHTTEFNLSSNDDTLEAGGTVIYRRRDVEALVDRLRARGHHVEPLDLDPGTGLLDRHVDVPPYLDEPHLRLRLERYTCTSVGLIVTRGAAR